MDPQIITFPVHFCLLLTSSAMPCSRQYQGSGARRYDKHGTRMRNAWHSYVLTTASLTSLAPPARSR